MQQVRKTMHVNATPESVFDVIADVENYPRLLPSCKNVDIMNRGASELSAKLTLELGIINGHYPVHFHFDRPGRARMIFDTRLFSCLEGDWLVSDGDGRTCDVELTLSYEFANRAAQLLLGPFLENTCNWLVNGAAAEAERRSAGIENRNQSNRS